MTIDDDAFEEQLKQFVPAPPPDGILEAAAARARPNRRRFTAFAVSVACMAAALVLLILWLGEPGKSGPPEQPPHAKHRPEVPEPDAPTAPVRVLAADSAGELRARVHDPDALDRKLAELANETLPSPTREVSATALDLSGEER